MEFFGIGMPEFMLILVIAIVIFGPDKIPQMAAQVGKAVRDFRRYTSDLTKEFNEATGGLKDEFTNIASDIRGELAQAQADLRSQLDLTDVLRMDTPAAAPVAVAAASGSESTPIVAEPDAAAASLPAPEPAPLPAESEPSPTITVMTPYAESLAAVESNGVSANGHVAETPALPIATKADPFADLAMLSMDGDATAETVTYVETAPISLAAASPEPAPEAVVDPEPMIAANGTNGHKPRVGGSVAGSKYARRRSA